MDLSNTACLYCMNLGGNNELYLNFYIIFLLLFVANFGNIPNRHYMHP